MGHIRTLAMVAILINTVVRKLPRVNDALDHIPDQVPPKGIWLTATEFPFLTDWNHLPFR